MSHIHANLKPKKMIFPSVDPSKLMYNPYNRSYIKSKKRHSKPNTNHRKFIKYASLDYRDDQWIGDDLSIPPQHNHTRFWSQNCQGLVTAHDINRYHFENQMYLDHNIHYLAFSETRINPAHTQTIYEIDHGFNHLVSHGRIDIVNTPGYRSNSAYQPGGVASAFHGRISNRYTKTIRDPAGRWVVHEFVGKEKPLRVYNVYRVNPKNSRADTSSWSQQKRFLQENNIDDDPRNHVITSLLEDLELSIQNGCTILLMGDFNESTTGREQTNQKLYKLGLHNVMQAKLNTPNLPRTHKRGSQAIDHVWATASILPAIPKAGFAPFDFLGSSDHRGICFDVDLDQLLDFNVVPLQAQPHRRLQSNIPKRVKKYIDNLTRKWKDFNIDAQLQKINSNIKDGILDALETDLNNLDQNISDAMKHAERKCSKVPGRVSAYWSPTFHKALTEVHKKRVARNKAQYVLPGSSIVDALHGYRDAQAAYDEALRHYREVKGKNAEVRKLDMSTLAEERAKENNSSSEVEYNKIVYMEQESKSNRKIKYVLKPESRYGVNSILIPARQEYQSGDDTFDYTDVANMWERITPHNGRDIKTWERVTDQSEMERILLR